jgi:hypothetical protein
MARHSTHPGTHSHTDRGADLYGFQLDLFTDPEQVTIAGGGAIRSRRTDQSPRRRSPRDVDAHQLELPLTENSAAIAMMTTTAFAAFITVIPAATEKRPGAT